MRNAKKRTHNQGKHFTLNVNWSMVTTQYNNKDIKVIIQWKA